MGLLFRWDSCPDETPVQMGLLSREGLLFRKCLFTQGPPVQGAFSLEGLPVQRRPPTQGTPDQRGPHVQGLLTGGPPVKRCLLYREGLRSREGLLIRRLLSR